MTKEKLQEILDLHKKWINGTEKNAVSALNCWR